MSDTPSEEMVDVAFRLAGGRVAVDHAYALSNAISDALPWFAEESRARLHQIHTAESGSGWMRPEASPGDELHISRRTRLVLRVPRRRTGDALVLAGRALDVGGYPLTPGAGKVLALAPAATLLARHVVCEEREDEESLVARLTRVLGALGVGAPSLICGRFHRIATPGRVLHTRSLVVTRLDAGGSMSLLRNGLGPAGKLGCGVFIPYKRIE